jgi:hypothetical protein
MIRRGFLSDYFEGVAVKRLSAVETSPDSSNQHEFNATKILRRLFGDADRRGIPTRFVWLGGEQDGISNEGFLSWYESRKPPRSEYRLYYGATDVSDQMREGDTFFLALRRDGTAMVIIVPADSTMQNQLLWLFGIEKQPEFGFAVKAIGEGERDSELDFTVRYILDELGIELEEPESDRLDSLIEEFGLKFPSTRDFSALARDSLPEIVPGRDDPDTVLMAWLEREEQLFRRLERLIVSERLVGGFMSGGEADVEGFLSFSLSVQNRRKARAGQSLENQLEALFQGHRILHSRGAETENRHKPDFLFPGIEEYRSASYPASRLTMLGSKSTLKDRWRQVLTEAERIGEKHLVTLEPAISEHQTDQMRQASLQLVLPRRLHDTYRESQREWLMSLSDFIGLVAQKQQH